MLQGRNNFIKPTWIPLRAFGVPIDDLVDVGLDRLEAYPRKLAGWWDGRVWPCVTPVISRPLDASILTG